MSSESLTSRLGYLLKHAQQRLALMNSAALKPHGIDGRELAILLVLADHEQESQQQAAGRLGIDRTTMVAFLDTLESKGLVTRRAHAEDRRKNVVELTETGREVLRNATEAADAAERDFLTPLSPRQGEQLKAALLAVIEGS
jgi:DNA-binding MarR family transcriptional regulator